MCTSTTISDIPLRAAYYFIRETLPLIVYYCVISSVSKVHSSYSLSRIVAGRHHVDNDDIVVPKSNSCYNCRFVDPFHTIDSCDDAVLFYDVGLYSDARVVSSSSRSVVVSLTRREAAQLPPRLAGIVELGLASNIDIKCHTATLSDIEMVGTEFESLKK